MKRIKAFLNRLNTLEDRIFAVILFVGLVVVVASAAVTAVENLKLYATICSVIAAFFFVFLIWLTYRRNRPDIARPMCCYFLNCVLLPVTFFACGGIDSGMPLYLLAGLFLIVPTLSGKQRIRCFVVSLIMHVMTIGFSYSFMPGAKVKNPMKSDFLATLSLEDRVWDMLFSLVLVSIFLFAAVALIFRAYQSEREKRESLLKQVDDLSRKDALTGLYNRRELFRKIEEIDIFSQKGYYIAMFDVDHFKKVNDNYGHIFGDVALRTISQRLRNEVVEESEVVARYGGEEFIFLFRAENDAAAFDRIDRIRRDIEEMKWEDHEGLSITISAGISECFGCNDLNRVLSDADQLLYQAKKTGRNKVVTGEVALS